MTLLPRSRLLTATESLAMKSRTFRSLLLSDRQKNTLERDAGWDPESLREEFRDGS
jgi:hypothetical protein